MILFCMTTLNAERSTREPTLARPIETTWAQKRSAKGCPEELTESEEARVADETAGAVMYLLYRYHNSVLKYNWPCRQLAILRALAEAGGNSNPILRPGGMGCVMSVRIVRKSC
jgi:hypothetical protein